MLDQNASPNDRRPGPAEAPGPVMESLRQAVADAPRPALIAAAAVGGALLLFGVVRLVSRPRRRGNWLAPPPAPSLFGTILRSALVSAASALASRFASRLPFPAEALPSPATRSTTLNGIG